MVNNRHLLKLVGVLRHFTQTFSQHEATPDSFGCDLLERSRRPEEWSVVSIVAVEEEVEGGNRCMAPFSSMADVLGHGVSSNVDAELIGVCSVAVGQGCLGPMLFLADLKGQLEWKI